ncbi:MAG: Arm DNA-binding domain-containing protein [Erythrobacter sp.]
MTKLTKRSVDAAKVHGKDYIIWDEELPSFGLRVFASGRRSYVIPYRARGRSRRFTVGKHGVWTAETARREAKVLLGRIA